MTASQIRQLAQPGSDRYRFVWGASPALMPAWTSLPASIRPILSWYMPYSRDISPAECRLGSSGGGDCVKGRNISWYEAHQRDWVLYQCDQRTPAFQYGDLNVPLDFTNPSVIEYQASLAMSARDAGYTAIAADNLAFENFAAFNACGVWRDGRWEQIFSGEVNDPRFAEATVAWAERFRQLLQKKMRLVITSPRTRRPVAAALLSCCAWTTPQTAFLTNLDLSTSPRCCRAAWLGGWTRFAGCSGCSRAESRTTPTTSASRLCLVAWPSSSLTHDLLRAALPATGLRRCRKRR